MPSPNVQAPSPAAACNSAAYQRWQQGYGVIRHSEDTEARVQVLARKLVADGLQPDTDTVYQKLAYLDRLTSAGLWLVVHMTYCNRVDISGAPLAAQDFKASPEGHTGGALNMVPAYAAYLALNNLTGQTRSWLMGQGHCVAAVDALNVLTGNLHPEQRARYLAPEGLSRLAADFYSYRQKPDGAMASPSAATSIRISPGHPGGRLPGLCRTAVRPHAAAGRIAGGLPLGWRRRGTERQRLDSALVAGRRLRAGSADHDCQWPKN